jgi:hypothetical protein
MTDDIVARLRSRSPYLHGSSAERAMDEAAAEIERLREIGNATFIAMCAFRDNNDEEPFQDAIDALGTALETKPCSPCLQTG